MQVSDSGGNPYWVLNALAIRPMPGTLTVSNLGGPVPADGVTVDTFTVTGATPGSIYTVSTTLGSVVTPDGDSRYAGVQVVPNSGTFTIGVHRPSGAGTATIRVEESTGAERGQTTQQYNDSGVRRFDFNSTSNDTQGGFIGVRGNNLFSPVAGFGWQTAVTEFQRGTAGYSKSSVSLFRDGHYGTAARTFQVAVTAGGTYDLRVYVGDRDFARDQIRVSVEGGPLQVVPNTAPNQFVSLELLNIVDAGADGILNIAFSDAGGSNPFWVVNGLDVAPSATAGSDLPTAAPQTAQALGAGASAVSASDLAQAKAAAIDLWRQAGASGAEVASLASTPLRLADLDSRAAFGLAFTDHVSSILIDDNAGGWGWHTDLRSAPPADRVDLLTVVLHELGHVLGYRDLDLGAASANLMSGLLTAGQRRVPESLSHITASDIDGSFSVRGDAIDTAAVDSVFAEPLEASPVQRSSSPSAQVGSELPARPAMWRSLVERTARAVSRLVRWRESHAADEAAKEDAVDDLFAQWGEEQMD
jgi:hypothetical protein